MMMNVDNAQTAAPAQPAPPAPSADTVVQSSAHEWRLPQLPARSVTTGETLRMVASPRPLYPLQPAVASSASENPLASPRPLIVDRRDTERLKPMLDKLGDETTFTGFLALATGSAEGREAAQCCKRLEFLEGNGDVDCVNVPSVKQLYTAAPNVTHLSINFPVAPAMSLEECLVPELEYLCVDETNEAWSINRGPETLDVLQARFIPTVEVHNGTPETVQKCVGFLEEINTCVLVDDGAQRYVRLFDRNRFVHIYAGGRLVGETRFLLNKETLGNIAELTLGEWVIQHEVELLFGAASPLRLDKLQVWFGARHASLDDRIKLLEYRGPGEGRCRLLKSLRLATTRPVARIPPRDSPLRPPLLRSVVEGFMRHLHGRGVFVKKDFDLELDGVAVEGCEDCDIRCANPPRTLEHSALFS